MKRKILTLIVCFLVLGNFMLASDFVNNKTYADSINCKSSILVDGNSGKILYENNIDEKLPIASIVKLMTLCLTFEAIENNAVSLDDLMQVSDYASSMGGSQLFLDANTSHKLRDLIKSVVISSANDSAVVIAENLAGSEENFVKQMNEKAKELNMTNTLFVDSSGLNEDGYSTARDVAILSKCVLNNELYKEYSKVWLDSYTHPSGRETELANTNKLLRKYDKCIAGKTGTTEKAGYCFTALSDNNGFKLISVVLGANTTNDRFDLAKELFLTGYANFKYVQLYEKDSFYNEIAIKNAKDNLTKTYVKDEIGIVTAKNEELNVTERVILYGMQAPVGENSSVGCVEFIQGDEIIAKVEIYVKDFVAKENYFNVIEKIIANW